MGSEESAGVKTWNSGEQLPTTNILEQPPNRTAHEQAYWNSNSVTLMATR
jgi:hypothetical protein